VGPGYIGLGTSATVKVLVGSADPSISAYAGDPRISYLANQAVLDGNRKVQNITDGTSNTVVFAEGYSYGFTSAYNNGTWDYVIRQGQWNVIPESAYTFKSGNFKYNYVGPVFGPVAGKTFQVRPQQYAADATVPQSLSSGALLVGLADGSVRGVSGGVSASTWYAALTPDAGDLLGPDW
jgi:Protein of unknown function (DUF1559)